MSQHLALLIYYSPTLGAYVSLNLPFNWFFFTSANQRWNDTVSAYVIFFLLSGWWVRVRLSAVGKWCMVNVAETQPGHKEGRNKGADDAGREDRRGLLRDIS